MILSAKREEINRITAVMKGHSEQLSSYPNVVGFGVGFKVKGGKKLDQLSIIVFVKKKVPRSDLKRDEVIPIDVEGVLTDVQESGEIIAYQARTDKWRPAPPGVSIGHYLITAGTFGCVVLKNGIRKILSNNHVLANCNAANIGDAIYQPGVFDGGGAGDTIALLEDWVPIVFSDVANNLIDVATAAPINDNDILNEILGLGIPTEVVEPELDMSVVKSGRTSAVSYGTITAINSTVLVSYSGVGTARFIDQIITTKMIWPGDSGSLLLTDPELKAVGLCFAASDVLGVASDIQYAESLLGISIFTGEVGSIDLYAKFVVGQGATDLLGEAEIRQPGSSELSSEVGIRHFDSVDLQCGVCVEHSVDLYCGFDVGQDSRDLLVGLVVTRASENNLSSKAVIRHVGTPIELLGGAVIARSDSVELLGKVKISYVAVLIELEPGSSKTFAPKIHSVDGALVELEPGSSKTFAPKIHSVDGALVELEPGSSKELALRFRSLAGSPLDTFGGPLSHYKPDYLRSWEGETLDVYGGPLTHYKPDYLRSREGSEFLTLWSLETGSRDLLGRFEVLRGWVDLQARFETGHDSVGLLARVEIGQDSRDLPARFESQATRDLLARADVGQDSQNLLGKVNIRHSASVELLGKTVIRHMGIPVELLCSVEILHWADLKARLCIPKVYDFSEASGVAFWWWGSGGWDQYIDFKVRTPTGSWIGSFPDGPAEWRLVFLEWDSDLIEVDLDGTRPDKSRINGFFWTYHTPGLRRLDAMLAIEEPLFWHTDLCVVDTYFSTQVIEKWDWDEQLIVTTILKDTYIRLSYAPRYGHSGWQFANINHGTSDYLRCSKFDGYPPGSFDPLMNDEEIFIKFDLGSISSLDRLGWARMELFRYYGYEYAKSRLNARRIAQCDQSGTSFVYWQPWSIIGGCGPSWGPYSDDPPHSWSETQVTWIYTGRWILDMNHISNWPYMGLSGFTQSSPTSHYGLTTDNNVWDMVRVDEILAGWLNGTYRNEGFGIRAEGIDGADSSGEMNLFRETPRFYSSNAADPRKPQLRLQYIPAASANLWSFANADRWQINLTDPYRGAGSLHLIDWTKVSYDRSRTKTAKVTFQTDLAFAEGCVDTIYRLNNATYPQLMYGAVYPGNNWVGYTTPIDNFFRIYFRYQDSNNYYMIQLMPAGETSRIIRRRYGGSVTLETFDSGIAVGDWERIRVFWVESAGVLHICCYVWDGVNWSFLGGYMDVNNYWATGGDVAFESYDSELDDTQISERIFP